MHQFDQRIMEPGGEVPEGPLAGIAEAQGNQLDIKNLLTSLVERSGSDLHLKVGQPPVFRIYGVLTRTEWPALTLAQVHGLVSQIADPQRLQRLAENKELDMAYSVPGLARFRVNIFYQKDQVGAVIRVIPIDIKTIEDLALPEVTKKFAELTSGLVLVTGPTGSGKSTTLAAIIDRINTTRKAHIITIEDPIEFLHQDKVAAINQRELGADTQSFASALKHVMRQNPDVILVGELRDLETISLALTAAETGPLVFATLHTTDSAQTIDRIVDVFPPEDQSRVRMQLANSLRAVISQTLVPSVTGGRVAAFEVLISHSGVKNLIREGKTHQIYNLIQTGASYGMQLLDQNLKKLLQDKVVSFDDAIAKASNPGDFEKSAPQAGGY
ncbi:MAG: type IV pilus twitching motility protein PilT [Actinomycetota bacterium]|nr:type IV pilus twitching motility protein PilT [Actinomycetota bacterium]